eukprot:SAG31_NODE_560_length_14088_cov_10.467010_3_plen_68_part_00
MFLCLNKTIDGFSPDLERRQRARWSQCVEPQRLDPTRSVVGCLERSYCDGTQEHDSVAASRKNSVVA